MTHIILCLSLSLHYVIFFNLYTLTCRCLLQLPIVDLTRTSCQGFTNAEQLDMRVAGLLEVEPLQFSINSYSEYIHVTHGSSPSECLLSASAVAVYI